MRKALIFFILFVFSMPAFSEDKFHERKYAVIEGASPSILNYLARGDYDVAVVKNDKIFLYLNEEELSRLKSAGFQVKYIPDPALQYAQELQERTWNSQNPMDNYHTYNELTAELQAAAAVNPNICFLESAGASFQGRQLWVMHISDHPDLDEEEPEFFYISSMHGNEAVGMELCMYLIDYLIDNYNENPTVQYLVNETHIMIMPLMNPDGYAAMSRYNAQGFDLNRNFPDRIDDPYNITTGRPHEVQVLMNYCAGISPVLSANYHCGTMVMNYPWDSNPNFQSVNTPTPDDAWFIEISLAYSTLNPPMFTGTFPQGITNGADWYTVYGGLQDWCYNWNGRADITIEVSDENMPPANELPIFWDNNQEAMIAYMYKVHQGVRGVVVSSTTDDPLPATITVDDNPHEVYTDPENGDYYRLLQVGTYTMHYYCYGYEPIDFAGVSVTQNAETIVDMAMTLKQPGYLFDNLEGGAAGYSHAAVQTGFSDQWNLSTQRSVTPTHSWKCGSTGTANYSNLLDAGLVTPVYFITPNSTLSFWYYIDTEISSQYYPYAYDGGLVELKHVDSTNWIQIVPIGGYPYRIRNTSGTGPFAPNTPVFAGYENGREVYFDLGAYQGQYQFRFRFGSDASVNREGWYIDDIELETGEGVSFDVTLTPENPPIIIPAAGGSFNFNISLVNNGFSAVNCDVWINVTLPNGNIYGPVVNAQNLNFIPGASANRNRTQNVPGSAPAGIYIYSAYAGQYPDSVIGEDHFSFTKSGLDNAGAESDSWNCSGIDFGENYISNSNSPLEYGLTSAYPNPFNSTVSIGYSLAKAGEVSLKIYDVTGRLKAVLFEGLKEAGEWKTDFNAQGISAGIYFVRLEANGNTDSMKIVYLK